MFSWHLPAVVVGLTLGGVATAELFVRWRGQALSPWLWASLAVVLCSAGVWRWCRIAPELRRLELGIRGEREVGHLLDDLAALGYTVLHDIPAKGLDGRPFNIDHVLIGPGGVFAVETKTRSLLVDRRAEVNYDGTRVLSTAGRLTAIRLRRRRPRRIHRWTSETND